MIHIHISTCSYLGMPSRTSYNSRPFQNRRITMLEFVEQERIHVPSSFSRVSYTNATYVATTVAWRWLVTRLVILFRWDFYFIIESGSLSQVELEKNLFTCLFSRKIMLHTYWISRNFNKMETKNEDKNSLHRCSKFNKRYESFDKLFEKPLTLRYSCWSIN